MMAQKRISAYISSFIFGSTYNVDGFLEQNFNESMFSTVQVMLIFLSLPLTYTEFPFMKQKDEKENKKKSGKKMSRLAYASTYLMNAVFVLMTTNYTLNPGSYYLWGIDEKNKLKSILLYFPLAQLLVGIIYFVIKIYDER